MAIAYVAHCSGCGGYVAGPIPAPQEPAVFSELVTFGAAAQSSVFGTGAKMVMVTCDADAHVAFGTDPTATANNYLFKANVEYVRTIRPGDRMSFYDGVS